MLPATLALIEPETGFSAELSRVFEARQTRVTVFDDSDALLTDARSYDYGFYVLDLVLPGIDGIDLIRILRRRTTAGVLVLSSRPDPLAYELALQTGADMYLCKPSRPEQVLASVQAVQRRVAGALTQPAAWAIDRKAGQLLAPDGIKVALSATDLAVMECFAQAQGKTVAHAVLRGRLSLPAGEDSDNALHATIYRLRRRIERASSSLFPLQSLSRVGYVFGAPLDLR